MLIQRWLLLLCSFLVFGAGQVACQDRTPPGSNAFGLRTIELRPGPAHVMAEVADTPQSRETGLMFRDSLAPDRGMLFVFETPQRASFWMKNTRIPLSVGFIDSAGTLLEVRDMQPFDETPILSRSERIAYALEVNQGWFERNHVPAGSKVEGLNKR
ncbi:MAG: DUF192 domain-containing protein [Verrucomicrobia bacterium]|nr:DUF192 domain-containing protein [Verrucomicrobiota bacterium]